VSVDQKPVDSGHAEPASSGDNGNKWRPALRTGFAMLGLVSLLDLPKGRPGPNRMVALGGAAAAGWFLVRTSRRR